VPSGIVEAPDQVDVLAEAQRLVEAPDRIERLDAGHQRCARHVAHPGSSADPTWLVTEVER
jgi:hypothetical protein